MGMFDEVTFEKNIFRNNLLMEKYNISIEKYVFQTKTLQEWPDLNLFRIIHEGDKLILSIEVDGNGDEMEAENRDIYLLNENRCYKKYIHSMENVTLYDFMYWHPNNVLKSRSYYKTSEEMAENPPGAGDILIKFDVNDGIITSLNGYIRLYKLDCEKKYIFHEIAALLACDDILFNLPEHLYLFE